MTTTNEDEEDLPLGTTEAAVRSCVRLISAVTCQPEKLCAYYLDLYYQVRRAYEREHEEPQAPPLTLEAAWPKLLKLIEETLRSAAEDQTRAILDGMVLHPAPPPDYPAPARTMNTPEAPEAAEAAETPSGAARQLPQGGSQETEAPAGKNNRHAHQAAEEALSEEARRAEIKRKRQENAAKAREAAKSVDRCGNKNAMANAKKEKLVIRERLLEAQKAGLTNTQLVDESVGQVTEGDLWRIAHDHNVGIAIYREINAALDRIEAKESINA